MVSISGCCNDFIEINDECVPNLDAYNLKNLLIEDFDKYQPFAEHAINVAKNSKSLKKNSLNKEICDFICQKFVETDYYIPEGSVVLSPRGRLGNHLFQYVAAYVLANHTNSSLYILNGSKLSNFNIEKEIFIYKNNLNSDYYDNYFNNSFNKDSKLITLNVRIFNEILKTDYKEVYKSIFHVKDFIHSRELVSKYHAFIKEKLAFVNIDHSKFYSILEKISEPNSVCIHVRRDDVTPTKNKYMYTSTEYYKKAIELSLTKIEDAKFFAFSDEIIRAKDELKEISNIEYISGNGPYEDLYLMNNCANNIISKGTFSFWSVALKGATNGFIIAPDYDWRYFNSSIGLNKVILLK